MEFITECCGCVTSDPIILDIPICPDCGEWCEVERIEEED